MGDAPVLAQVHGQVVTLSTLLSSAELRHHLLRVVDMATERLLVQQACVEAGLSASTVEVQASFNAWRRDKGLLSADKTRRWMAQEHLTLDDLEADARYRVLHRKWLAHVAVGTDAWFHEHRSHFQQVALARVLVGDQDLAAELMAELDEAEISFEELVARNSQDQASRARGGYWGEFTRDDLTPAISAAAFAAHPGQVLGPFPHGHDWVLLKVLARRDGTLDDATRQGIVLTLYRQWLEGQRQNARETPCR